MLLFLFLVLAQLFCCFPVPPRGGYPFIPAMIVKNEALSLSGPLSFLSRAPLPPVLLVLDTGSTDNTTQVLEELCGRLSIRLHLKRGGFGDFSTARNTLLDHARGLNFSHILTLDAGDEISISLKPGERLKPIPQRTLGMCMRTFVWRDGSSHPVKNEAYCLVPTHPSIRYHGKVHEIVLEDRAGKISVPKTAFLSSFQVEQDRTEHGNSSRSRFPRDLELLSTEVDDRLLGVRSHFLIGNTYSSMGEVEKAVAEWELFLGHRDRLCGSEAADHPHRAGCFLADPGSVYVAHFRLGLYYGNQTISGVENVYQRAIDHLESAAKVIRCPGSLFVAAKVAFSAKDLKNAKRLIKAGKDVIKTCPPQAPLLTDPKADLQWLEHNVK